MKRIISVVFLACMLMSVTASADPVAELHTDEGDYVINYYETHESKDGIYLYLIFDWTNGGTEASEPLFNYMWEAYQNGKKIESDIDVYYQPDTDGFGGTSVKPGYTTTGYYSFKLSDYSSVEITLSTDDGYFSDNPDEMVSFVIDPSAEAPEPQESPVQPSGDEPGLTDSERIAALEERVSELERIIAEMNN